MYISRPFKCNSSGWGLSFARFANGIQTGLGRQEGNQDFARLQFGAFCEWAGGNCLSQFVGRAEDDLRTKSEFLLDRILNLLSKLSRVFLPGPEDDVAALDIGARILEFEALVKGAKSIHLDPVVRTEVDAAEHRDQNWHDPIPWLRSQGFRHHT